MIIISVQKNRSYRRYCLLLVALLAGMAMLASVSPAPEAAKSPPEISVWRRTRDGWEQPRWPADRQPPGPVPPHPLCVAVLTILLAAMGLVGYTPRLDPARAVPPPHFNAALAMSAAATVAKSG